MGLLPGKRPSLETPASFMLLLGLLLFDILTLIRGLVIFRLHYHQYFHQDTISRWLLTNAEECFTCPWDMATPRWRSTQIFQSHCKLLLLLLLLLLLFLFFTKRIRFYQVIFTFFLRKTISRLLRSVQKNNKYEILIEI